MATTQMEIVPVASQDAPSLPRKRRRRTPATGAAEDCFTCRKKESKCDRRRPYCSQCLEVGNQCSGYRTTLTWGVGVASRGQVARLSAPFRLSLIFINRKLRGMAIPILNLKTPASNVTSSPNTIKPVMAKEASAKHANDDSGTEHARKRPRLPPLKKMSPTVKSEMLNPTSYPEFMGPSFSTPQWRWQSLPMQNPPHDFTPLSLDQLSPSYQLRHHYTHAMSQTRNFVDPAMSPSTGSMQSSSPMDAYSDTSFDFATNYSSTSEDTRYMIPTTPFSDHYATDPSNLYDYSLCSTPRSSVLETSPRSMPAYFETWSAMHAPDMALTPHQTQGSPQTLGFSDFEARRTAHPQLTQSKQIPLASPRQSFNLQTYNIAPRMCYLLDYYDREICPVLVASDAASNPYRRLVLRLSMESAGLQNAIAALATNNMRMKGVRKSIKIESKESSKELISASMGQPSAEEQHYKARSIELLNEQLADHHRASDDSVLATLLILCLFHVCDSGFSKFKTQLAGVHKLLRLRGRKAQTEFVGWVEMFFAWFDVMTSAVNDREIQINSESLDLMNLSSDLGALEQFSGCEGRLFKLIARLGRLNLLSQRRSVRRASDSSWQGSGSTIERTTSIDSSQNLDGDRQETNDERVDFWNEWQDTRERLQAWELHPPPGQQAAMQRDMSHISESFRYSALLYTERLANPTICSSSENIQKLVRQALFHIGEIGVNSCVLKFMLWPVFITGTECVDEKHRDTIRDRCIEIMKESGFYNNVSGLEVLERVWQASEKEAVPQRCGAQAFRWRQAMDRADGEYIVI